MDALIAAGRPLVRGTTYRKIDQSVDHIYDSEKLVWDEGRDKFIAPYMHEDAKSDDFLESVKQIVPLNKCKTVLKSSYFD